MSGYDDTALAAVRTIGDLQADNVALRKRVAELERLKDLYLQTRNDLVEENDKLVEKSAKLQADLDAALLCLEGTVHPKPENLNGLVKAQDRVRVLVAARRAAREGSGGKRG